jgi:hypothetical protein
VRDWKQAERRIASILGGVQVPVPGRRRGDAPDVLHPRLSVEVKSRSKLPAWIEEGMRQAESSSTNGRVPVCVLHQDRRPYEEAVVLVRLSHFARNFTENREYTEAGEKGA